MNQDEWFEYFATVNGRKPSASEFAAAKAAGEFVSQAQDVETDSQKSEQLQSAPQETSQRSFCPHCGSPVKAGAGFCNHCGQKLGADNVLSKATDGAKKASAQANQQAQKIATKINQKTGFKLRKSHIIGIAAGIVVIIVVIIFLLIPKGPSGTYRDTSGNSVTFSGSNITIEASQVTENLGMGNLASISGTYKIVGNKMEITLSYEGKTAPVPDMTYTQSGNTITLDGEKFTK